MNEDSNNQTDNNGASVDLDKLKEFGWQLLTSGYKPLLQIVLATATPLP
jgi:hypothetical protein